MLASCLLLRSASAIHQVLFTKPSRTIPSTWRPAKLSPCPVPWLHRATGARGRFFFEQRVEHDRSAKCRALGESEDAHSTRTGRPRRSPSRLRSVAEENRRRSSGSSSVSVTVASPINSGKRGFFVLLPAHHHKLSCSSWHATASIVIVYASSHHDDDVSG